MKQVSCFHSPLSNVETCLFPERNWQRRTPAPLDQKRGYLCDLAEGIVMAQRPFQVTGAARAAGAHTQSDHAADHHEMPVAPVGEQFIDLGEGVEQFKRQIKDRQIAVQAQSTQ